MEEPQQLFCWIADIQRAEHWSQSDNYRYVVSDGKKDIATGVSSSPNWVKHDAGGYHTKKMFDEMFPQGWNVFFAF